MFAELADGRRLEFPDGTDPTVIQATVKKLVAPKAPELGEHGVPLSLGSFGDEPTTTPAERIAASPVTRLAIGAARPVVAATQAIDAGMKAVLPKSVYDIARPELSRGYEETQKLAKAGGQTGADVAGFAGEVLNPFGLAVSKAVPVAGGLIDRMKSGAQVGAAYGAGSPVQSIDDFASEKGGQIAGGAAFGGAIPMATTGLQAGGNALLNLVPSFGTNRIASKALNEAAGTKRDQIIQLLTANRQLVPGSQGHAGEVAAPAGSTEFGGLQDIVTKLPGASTAYRDMDLAQNAARVAAVRTVGRDRAALQTAEGARAANAATNYGAAYQQAIKADPELAQLSKNPFFQSALPDAMRLAEANQINPKTDLTQFLHYVKLSLDKQLGKTGDTALSRTEQEAVNTAKGQLVSWLEKKNPDYGTARAAFAADSKPINQMQVGQYLEGKLTSPLSDEAKQRAVMYTQALRDAPGTLKRSTAFKSFDDLSQVLEPGQVQTVKAVGEDLARKAAHQDLASRGRSAAAEILDLSIPRLPASGMFNPKYSVARAILNRLSGKVENRTLRFLADKMQDPQEVAKLMNLSPPQRAKVIDALIQSTERGAVIGAGAAQ